jgi:hypothetical protein
LVEKPGVVTGKRLDNDAGQCQTATEGLSASGFRENAGYL